MELLYTLDRHSCSTRRVSTALGRVIVLLLLFTLTSCEQSPQRVRLRTLSAREFYPLALERAQQWKPDAYLESIEVGVLSEEDFTRQILLFFGFESPSDDRHSLLITFREDAHEPKVKNIDHQVPIQVRNPINSEDWPLDSVDVLPLALENGGDEFLARHDLERALMILYLERWPNVPGAHLLWRASFWDLAASEKVWILLDPKAGEVVEVKWQPSR